MNSKYIQIIVLASVFALQFLAEHLYPQKEKLTTGKTNALIWQLVCSTCYSLFSPQVFCSMASVLQAKNLGLIHQFTLPFGVELVITILLMDFWMYVWHRWNHERPFLWRFHSFHHRDTKMNSTTALRFHVVELFLSYPGKGLVCFIFGISYLPLLVYEILFFIAVIIHHSNIRITKKQDAVYRTLFASPLMHRIHHSERFEETNSNFGALFSFWDRLFRSSTKEPEGKVVFGLPKEYSRNEKINLDKNKTHTTGYCTPFLGRFFII